MLTPGEALWTIANLRQTPPPGVMRMAWINQRYTICLELQKIVDEIATQPDDSADKPEGCTCVVMPYTMKNYGCPIHSKGR